MDWNVKNNPILTSTRIKANLEEMGLAEFSSWSMRRCLGETMVST